MISTQRPAGSLFGEIRGADAVVEHLGGGARRRAQPALAQILEDRRRGERPERSHMKWTSIGE